MQRVSLNSRVSFPVIRRWTQTGRASGVAQKSDETRGFNFDQTADVPNMLQAQRQMDGEIEGFKSRFFQVNPNDPEQSARVLSYFKSRQPPPCEKILSFREALKKPRAVLKKTQEQVSSFLSRRPASARTANPEPAEPSKDKKNLRPSTVAQERKR